MQNSLKNGHRECRQCFIFHPTRTPTSRFESSTQICEQVVRLEAWKLLVTLYYDIRIRTNSRKFQNLEHGKNFHACIFEAGCSICVYCSEFLCWRLIAWKTLDLVMRTTQEVSHKLISTTGYSFFRQNLSSNWKRDQKFIFLISVGDNCLWCLKRCSMPFRHVGIWEWKFLMHFLVCWWQKFIFIDFVRSSQNHITYVEIVFSLLHQ